MMKAFKNKELDGDDCDGDGLLGFDENSLYFNKKVNNDGSNGESLENGSQNGQYATQYFRWTPESIKMMLKMRFTRDQDFSQRLRQKKDLWNEIAAEMGRTGGFILTGELCDLKFRNMLQTYKKNRLKEKRGLQELIVWEYYAMFKEAMPHDETDSKYQLIPSMLCESVCNEDAYNETSVINEATQHMVDMANLRVDQKLDVTSRTNRKRLFSMHSQPENNFDQNEQENFMNEQKVTSFEAAADPKQNLSATISPRAEMLSVNRVGCNVVSNNPTPPWLTPTELSECDVFGQSIGIQLANVRDSYSRALLKLKIQELLFLAGTGKLNDASQPCSHGER